MSTTQFIAIDPGMSTGVTHWQYNPHSDQPAQLLDATQFTGGLDAFRTWWARSQWAAAFLVVEQFKPDGRATHIDEFEPIRIEGAIGTLWGNSEIIWQTNQALTHTRNQQIINAGYWVDAKQLGQPDNNDAISSIKHALYWLKQNHLPTHLHVWGTP